MGQSSKVTTTAVCLGILIGAGLLGAQVFEQETHKPVMTQFIVQASSTDAARAQVEAIGGTVISDLAIIRGVSARLTAAQARQLAARDPALRLRADGTLNLSAKVTAKNGPGANDTAVATNYAQRVDASTLHAAGIDGSGVTVAFVDTGIWNKVAHPRRTAAVVDVLGDAIPPAGFTSNTNRQDDHGHGTHIMSTLVASDDLNGAGTLGVAPGIRLISVRAFDGDGRGSYVDVIEALDWLVRTREQSGVRIVNLSFGAAPQSHYWDDPLNQAVMAAWAAGIVVVASAGNTGPEPMTIGVPGNVPYVITVGATSDNYTPHDPHDDFLTSYSSVGPTVEGFVKPDVLAPGERLVSRLPPSSMLAKDYRKEAHWRGDLFAMSGTSQSAAITSGVAALILQASPELGPDDVKCRLMAGAQLAMAGQDELHYPVFQQGAGMVNAANAVHATALGCANVGLDVIADLSGERHFGGPVRQDGDGNFVLIGPDGNILEAEGYTWGGQIIDNQGYTWGGQWTQLFANGYTWGGQFLFSQGYTWGGQIIESQGYTWGGQIVENRGYTWGGQNVDLLAIQPWVPADPPR